MYLLFTCGRFRKIPSRSSGYLSSGPYPDRAVRRGQAVRCDQSSTGCTGRDRCRAQQFHDSREKIEESVALLRELNDKAPFITTPIAQLPGKKILETMESSKSLEEELLDEIICPECGHHHEEGECCGHDHEYHHDHDHEGHEHHHDHDHEGHEHHHGHDHEEHGHHHDHEHHHHDHAGHHHADDVFTSWGRETIHTYTKDQIGNILKTLESDSSYGNVLRAKGMVAGADGEWIYFDMVPEEHEVRTGAPEYTGRICVIGAELNEDKLAELFGVA